jgi:hypothetical protein
MEGSLIAQKDFNVMQLSGHQMTEPSS